MSQAAAQCFPCSHPARYDAESIRWFKAEKKLCEDHEKKAEALLAQVSASDEPKKLITRVVKKNWQDKELGDE